MNEQYEMKSDILHNVACCYSSRQQYSFDNTCRCMYSFVLLMMNGRTAWNT